MQIMIVEEKKEKDFYKILLKTSKKAKSADSNSKTKKNKGNKMSTTTLSLTEEIQALGFEFKAWSTEKFTRYYVNSSSYEGRNLLPLLLTGVKASFSGSGSPHAAKLWSSEEQDWDTISNTRARARMDNKVWLSETGQIHSDIELPAEVLVLLSEAFKALSEENTENKEEVVETTEEVVEIQEVKKVEEILNIITWTPGQINVPSGRDLSRGAVTKLRHLRNLAENSSNDSKRVQATMLLNSLIEVLNDAYALEEKKTRLYGLANDLLTS